MEAPYKFTIAKLSIRKLGPSSVLKKIQACEWKLFDTKYTWRFHKLILRFTITMQSLQTYKEHRAVHCGANFAHEQLNYF